MTTVAAPPAPLGGSIRERASFSFIRYGSVWEDADVLCEALAPVAEAGRLLSVASAGDNVLALLTLDPAEVVAVDLSAAQLACLELRIAAFRRLDDTGLHAFLGVTPSETRHAIYRRLRFDLTRQARAFWDAQPEAIRTGIIHAGKFERYLRTFRRRVLPLIQPRARIERLRAPCTVAEQEEFYDREWNSWRWRALFRLFFSRAVMGRRGRDPEFFAQVSGSVGTRILERTGYALTTLPVRSNPYLAYIMTGNYPPEALPRYLRPEHIGTIRRRLDRVRLVEGRVEEAASGRFDGFNLSDVFEYMSPEEHERCYTTLVDRARPGARLAYWNLLAPRACPDSQRHRVRALTEAAAALHARDLAWFYQAFHLDEVEHGGGE
ncbi:MAG TPA: DUF3419 family protein [Longimicrobiaceae bacterium]|nr:DUF3419 family protein [Longimicrobiaceae bacterium]